MLTRPPCWVGVSFLQAKEVPPAAVQGAPPSDLKDLVASRLVAVVAHVAVGGRRSEVEDVAEDANDPQQTLHLRVVAAGQATEKTAVIGPRTAPGAAAASLPEQLVSVGGCYFG